MTSSASSPAHPTVQAGSFLTLHYRLSGPAGDVINTFNDKPATLSLGA
ncbi:MAG: peptidylprolyl isomerase, partial [Delftia sp.]|nr:peptidylprolyl isomerase [Delftia sp.]